MTAATECYADVKAERSVAIGEAKVEKAVNRPIRWTIAVFITMNGLRGIGRRSFLAD